MRKVSVNLPALSQIVVSQDKEETVMIRAIVSIQRVHYVAFIPLVSQFPFGEFYGEDDLGYEDLAEPLGFARIQYDYVSRKAHLRPLNISEDADTIDNILYVMGSLI